MKKWIRTLSGGFILLLLIAKWSPAQYYGEIEEKFDQLTLHTNPLFNYEIFNFPTPDSNSSRLDIFISVSNALLQFVKQEEGGYVAQFELNITIYEHKKEDVTLYQSFEQRIEEDSYQKTVSRGIRHYYFYSVSLKPRRYKMLLELVDLDTRKSLQWKSQIKVKTFRKANFNFSDIVFYQIDTTNVTPRLTLLNVSPEFFQKTPYAHYPQLVTPSLVNQRKLYIIGCCFGIYHEVFVTVPLDSLLLTYEIINSSNRVVYKREIRKKVIERLVVGEFKINKIAFAPGEHLLRITVSGHGKPCRIQKEFFFSPVLTVQNIDDYVDLAIRPLRYVANSKEYRQMLEASEKEKKVLLEAFWAKRDPTPQTPENELREEFYRRVNFANRHFFNPFSNRQGWETDRGRIFIIYGPPDDVERPPVKKRQPLYEIWTYQREDFVRRVIFVFKPEWGEFQLVTME